MSPIKKEADPNLVAQFCQKLNNNFDGIQTAIRLITNKMQSSQEWEALISLYVNSFYLSPTCISSSIFSYLKLVLRIVDQDFMQKSENLDF